MAGFDNGIPLIDTDVSENNVSSVLYNVEQILKTETPEVNSVLLRTENAEDDDALKVSRVFYTREESGENLLLYLI